MIVIGSVIAIVLIGAYVFLGMKISETIAHSDIRIFFWALYTTTLLTLVNVSISIYFYASLVDKKGPLGPRGLKGILGDKGDNGSCEDTCRTKTVQIMVEEAIQKFKDENDITPMERKTICNMVNDNGNTTKINTWELDDLKKFKVYLDTRIDDTANTDINKLINHNLDERIVNQNSGSDNYNWVKVLIINASSNQITQDKQLLNVQNDVSACN